MKINDIKIKGVSCSTHGTDYTCGPCPPGLVGDGENCGPPGLCSPNPCFPGSYLNYNQSKTNIFTSHHNC